MGRAGRVVLLWVLAAFGVGAVAYLAWKVFVAVAAVVLPVLAVGFAGGILVGRRIWRKPIPVPADSQH